MSTTAKAPSTKKRTTTTNSKAVLKTEVELPIPIPIPAAPVKAAADIPAPAPTKTVAKAAAPAPAIIEQEPLVVEETTENGNVIRTEIKKKRVATRDTVLQSFDSICQSIIDEISNSKDDKNVNGKSLKFLRNINKNLGSLKKDAGKLIRQKKKTLDPNTISKDDINKDGNKMTSGFLKPVPISVAMSTFTGWSPTELKSRVDVTKFLCNYIKENNLQNPIDRRQILADTKLAKLLDYKDGTPLTYFDMQSHLKKHFPKTVVNA